MNKVNKVRDIASRLDVPTDVASSSHSYAQRFAGLTGEYFLQVQRDAVLEHLKTIQFDKNKSILEIGGGHCQLTQTYLDLGFEVTIHGSDERSFTRAYDLGFKNHPKVTFVSCPIDQLNFREKEFDIVSGIRLIAHLDDWQSFLSSIYLFSKKGIIFDYANLKTLNFLNPSFYGIKEKIEKNSRPFNCHSPNEIKSELEKLGCEEILSTPQFILPMGIHRKLNNKTLSQKFEFKLNSLGLKFLGNPVIVFARKKSQD